MTAETSIFYNCGRHLARSRHDGGDIDFLQLWASGDYGRNCYQDRADNIKKDTWIPAHPVGLFAPILSFALIGKREGNHPAQRQHR